MRGLRNLRLILLLIALQILAATTGFHFLEHWPWFDSLYMVLTTVTTIGYSEFQTLDFAGRLFNVFVIVTGVGLVFLAIGALASTLLEFELRKFFGRRRMEREISRLKDHYIICGAGRVGRSVARELMLEPAPFVIIESNLEKAARFGDAWLMLIGDATKESTLREAHIENAKGLIAAASTDAINVYIILTARSLNPKLKIIARASEEDAEKHLLTAGADTVISPYNFAGRRIAQSFLRPHVLDFLDIATARESRLGLEIEEVLIDSNSPFAGKTLESSRIRQELGVIVLAIKGPGRTMFNPSPEDRIESGDHLIAMGEPSRLRALESSAIAKR